jgi:ABC-type multidrug transport system ATPase subunit
VIRARQLAGSGPGGETVTGIDLEVARGECLGLIGGAGSGRTTLLRILATLLPPNSGSAEIDGLDVVRDLARVRTRVAYVGQPLMRGEALSVREHLLFLESARGRSDKESGRRVEGAALRAGLAPAALVLGLPPAERLRLELAGVLMLKPVAVLLDDAFPALDTPEGEPLLHWLRESRDAGAAIVLGAPEAGRVRALASRVSQLQAGRLVAVAAGGLDAAAAPSVI